MMSLTPRMRELLAYLRERETPPTYQQMANALGLKAKSNAYRLVDALIERGYALRIGGEVVLVEQHRPRLRVIFGPEELEARAALKRRLWSQRKAA